MALLSKEQIFGTVDVHKELVDVTKWWGGEVFVRSMTGPQRDKFEFMYNSKEERVNVRAYVASVCVCDENGERIFSDSDLGMLKMKNAAALDAIFDVAARLSGMRDNAVREAEKNSEPTPNASGGTA